MISISKINPLNFAKNLVIMTVIMMVFINIINLTFKLLLLNIWPPCPTPTSVVISIVTGNFNICMGPPPKLITFFY